MQTGNRARTAERQRKRGPIKRKPAYNVSRLNFGANEIYDLHVGILHMHNTHTHTAAKIQ